MPREELEVCARLGIKVIYGVSGGSFVLTGKKDYEQKARSACALFLNAIYNGTQLRYREGRIQKEVKSNAGIRISISASDICS